MKKIAYTIIALSLVAGSTASLAAPANANNQNLVITNNITDHNGSGSFLSFKTLDNKGFGTVSSNGGVKAFPHFMFNQNELIVSYTLGQYNSTKSTTINNLPNSCRIVPAINATYKIYGNVVKTSQGYKINNLHCTSSN